ncbi:MAG TPA: gliding motility-associated C-terminal domain-containing protein [Bacteroidia bacterium]|nr:gliding motility-associated C-terminal domain-containing protein [Bacteroidia bacterium]
MAVFCIHHVQAQTVFTPNAGQWNNQVFYKADIHSGHVFFEQNKLMYAFYSKQDLDRIHEEAHHAKSAAQQRKIEQQKVRCYAYEVSFPGANAAPLITGADRTSYNSNYFLGNDPQKWAPNVANYRNLTYHELYPGVDVRFSSPAGQLKYDFIVAAGTDPSAISMQYSGLKAITMRDGNLILDAGFMEITEAIPYAYQEIEGVRTEIRCEFILDGNVVRFVFPNGYDARYNIVIDPVVIASTYSGGTVTTYGHSATYDNAGQIYSAGRVFGAGFPATAGAYDLTFAGSVDLGISQYNPTGTTLQYCTYIGGTADEYAHSMFVHNNELYIYGSAMSTDYPTTGGAYDGSHNGGYDIIVTHLNSTGSALIGSTYIGGTANDGFNAINTHYGDTFRGEIIVDASGNALVASFSSSTDFPATAGAYDLTNAGAQDGVVLKLSPNMGSLMWATYLGGSGNDGAFGVRINSTGQVYVCGATGSSANDFPITVGTYQTTYQGGTYDGFLLQLDANGTALGASTLFGTSGLDEAFFLDIDYDDDVYIYGEARGGAPVTPGVYSMPGSAMMVAKFNPALTTLMMCTVIGDGTTTSTIAPSAFMVDVCKNIYLAGFGAFSGWPVTANAIYGTSAIGSCYLATLSPGATALLFGSFYGGNHVDGGTSRFDPSGIIYHAVCQGGSGFPTTPGAWNAGVGAPSWDVCVFKIDFEQMGVQATAVPNPNASGCAPFLVNFQNTSTGITYIWDFGDGSPLDTSTAPSHTFDSTGTYTVMLVAIDSASCNISDTAYITISVLSQISTFLGPDTSFCPPGTVTLDAGISGASYVWSTGDTTQTVSVNQTGNYWVTVTLGSCSATDTMSVQTFQFNPASGDALVCQGLSVDLTANNPGSTYEWSTGATTQTITVNTSGMYWVEMTHGNCVTTDTIILDYTIGGDVMPPNVFTPNGDGVNDFYDVGDPAADLFRLEIYDRWGVMVFLSTDPVHKWDGMYNKDEAVDGVYYWILHYVDCAGEPGTQTGFVHLIREK